ncbi:hypothetical protein OS493_022766 [Desmophyllum pertusum]|uniref:Uncharacterized protein n=1 Tax=Desmophyllum pertusum TaxID=174260 RepID=A0A9W9YAR8_9CNID|nr:hypothetical protein OS493_022766 [Desmophyllum pertusum]
MNKQLSCSVRVVLQLISSAPLVTNVVTVAVIVKRRTGATIRSPVNPIKSPVFNTLPQDYHVNNSIVSE